MSIQDEACTAEDGGELWGMQQYRHEAWMLQIRPGGGIAEHRRSLLASTYAMSGTGSSTWAMSAKAGSIIDLLPLHSCVAARECYEGSWGNQARVSARKCCRRKEKGETRKSRSLTSNLRWFPTGAAALLLSLALSPATVQWRVSCAG